MRKIFNQCLKKPIKVAIILVLLLASGIILKIKFNSNEQLAFGDNNQSDISMVTVKRGSKIYEIKGKEDKDIGNNSIEDKEKEEVKIESNKNDKSIFSKLINKDETVKLETKDIDAPSNVSDVDVKILENNAIINFKVPEDNGTDYKYVIENGNDIQNVDFHSESGILGYSYKISNNVNDTADIKPNKLENSSILLQDINWSNDYYLHIRTIDNSMNYSENSTFKIDLPSNGVNIEYVDNITGDAVSSQEKISGMINEQYDAEILKKKIDNYTLIDIAGEEKGKLKKEAINVKYKYAKNAKLTIKYINGLTGEEIARPHDVYGYEGKEINIKPLEINNFISEEQEKNIKMKVNETITFIYDAIEESIKENNDKKLNEDIKESDKQNEKEEIQDSLKDKEEKQLKIKYVDIDTNKILYEEKIAGNKGKKIKIKLKEIEGYRLVNNIEGPDNDSKKSSDSDSTIIDEIIESLGEDKIESDYNKSALTKLEEQSLLSQYEIVMNCDDSDYIIYYKK